MNSALVYFPRAEVSFVFGPVAEHCGANQNHQLIGVVTVTKTMISSSCSTGRVPSAEK